MSIEVMEAIEIVIYFLSKFVNMFFVGVWFDCCYRDALQKFFFPQEYQTHEITPKPVPGDIRQFASLNFRLNILAVATMDMLFTKNKVK